MITNVLDVNTAIEEGKKLEYVFIRNLSEMYLGKTSELQNNINFDEMIEIKFFSNNKEIRLFKDGEISAFSITLEDGDEILTKEFKIQNNDYGSEIGVSYVLNYDEDGQVYTNRKILTSWKGAV